MNEPPTPGQVAYTAYARALNLAPYLTWAILPPRHQAAWDAAAQAVLEACVASARPLDTAQEIVAALNARERASLEELRRQADDTP